MDFNNNWNLSKRAINNNYNIIYGYYMQELSNKVNSIFEFENLPETVDENFFKLSLILTGHCSLVNIKNEWYAVHGQRGGTPNPYYIPENYIIANPALGSETVKTTDNKITVFYLTPFDECTTIGTGLFGLINRTADSLTHTDISINTALKNSRVVAICECSTDTDKERINETFNKMRSGGDVFTVKTGFDDEIKINPFLNGANIPEVIRELVELRQYILANFYHSIGINSNYNLKRAQISNEEIKTNDDILIVNTYEIKSQLEKGCKEFNEKTGMNISVRYSDAWQQLRETETAETEETNNTETESEDKENEK